MQHGEMQGATVRFVMGLVGAALVGVQTHAADLRPHFTSSASEHPRGDVGLSVESDKIKVDANVALRAPDRTVILPRLSSAFALSDRLGLETRIDWSAVNGPTDGAGAKVDTSLHYRSSVPFLNDLEGRVWRSPDGRTGRILKFGFYQKLGFSDRTAPLTFRGKASVEATSTAGNGLDPAADREDRRLRIETELRGLRNPLWPGRAALRMKLERAADAAGSSSVAYDQSWGVGAAAELGMSLALRRSAERPLEGFEPSVALSWRWEL